MLKPLEQWHCDVCGEVIECPKDGYVIWKNDDDHRDHDFTVIHKIKCDPKKGFPCSMPIETFLGADGLVYLTSFLSLGPIKGVMGSNFTGVRDFDEFVDFMRRMQTPYYEDARRFYETEDVVERYNDANEVMPYMPEYCEKIAREEEGIE